MPKITIAGTVINFPDQGNSPNWAPAVIQFAEAVANALNFSVGQYDVPPQKLTIDSTPSGTLSIGNLFFSPSVVQGAFIKYSVYRNTSLTTVAETGILILTYNSANPTGNKWEIAKAPMMGDAKVSFAISDAGQVTLTTQLLSGTNHNGFIYFTAQAMLS